MDTTLLVKTYEDAFQGDSPDNFLWSSEKAKQDLRYKQLLKVIDGGGFFRVLDFGCGSGSLAWYIDSKAYDFIGVDLNQKALEVAKRDYPAYTWVAEIPDIKVDFSFVSGTFNFHPGIEKEEWLKWVESTIKKLWSMSTYGVAMNFLTYRPDWREKDCWYPSSPRQIIDMLHSPSCTHVVEDYGLRGQWTLLAWK